MRLPTASRLDLFWACSGPWHLPLPDEPEPTSKAAERGKTIHAQVETGDTSTADGQRAARAMEDLPPHFALESVPLHEVVVFYDLDTGPGILGYVGANPRENWPRREKRIYGIADYVARTASHLLIADLKTGSAEWLKMPWEELQTRFLSAVVSQSLNWTANTYACIVSSEAERAWCQEWTSAELRTFLSQISMRVTQEEKVATTVATTYHLTPGEHCTFCLVRKKCPLMGYASAT